MKIHLRNATLIFNRDDVEDDPMEQCERVVEEIAEVCAKHMQGRDVELVIGEDSEAEDDDEDEYDGFAGEE